MWDNVKRIAYDTRDYLDQPLLHFGNSHISLLSILFFIGASIFVIYLARWAKRFMVKRLFPRYHIEVGVSEAIGTISQYFIFVIGFIIVLDSSGIDLSSLKIIAGALGVGIGFGLQNIVHNFVSGLIILFERPVKIGDRIEVGLVNGDVVKIASRATTIVTNDNISIIVPNSEFTTKSVTNWSHANNIVRFNYPISVSYKENPERVRQAILEVADTNSGVLQNPRPDVLFDSFGDSSLTFILRIWTKEYMDRPGVLKSQLYYAIFKKFGEVGIEMPYPQRDLHLVSMPKEPILVQTQEAPGKT